MTDLAKKLHKRWGKKYIDDRNWSRYNTQPQTTTTTVTSEPASRRKDVAPTPTAVPVSMPVLKVEKQSVASIEAGEPATFSFSTVDVSEIKITLGGATTDVDVEVSALGGRPENIPTEPSGRTYSYMDITAKTRNFALGGIDSAAIGFKVMKGWMNTNNIDKNSIMLNRYSGGEWSELSTTMTGEDGSYGYYEAETPGFSTFAITGRGTTGAITPTVTPTVVPTAAVPTPTVTPTAVTPTPTPSEVDTMLIGGVILLIIVTIIVVASIVYKEQIKEITGRGKQEKEK